MNPKSYGTQYNFLISLKYTAWLRKLESLFHICPKNGATRKNEMEFLATMDLLVLDTSNTL
jgi:hypothetical protein